MFLYQFSITLEAIGLGKIDFAEAGTKTSELGLVLPTTNGTHVYVKPTKNPLLLFSGTGTWGSS